MYETLYEFTKMECYLKSLGAGVIVGLLWVFVLFQVIRSHLKVKSTITETKDNAEYKHSRFVTIIITCIITPIVVAVILSMHKDIFISYNYLYDQYKNGNYHTVEGKVQNYEHRYEGKDKDIRIIEFEIDGVSFIIDRNYAGYDIISDECVVKHDGQELKITYMLEKDLDLDKYYMIGFNDETKNGIVKIEEKVE